MYRAHVFILALMFCSLSGHASAATSFYAGEGDFKIQDRYALVIAVPTVKKGGFRALVNPVSDAKAVTEALKELGFRSVINLYESLNSKPENMTRQAIKFALYDFVKKLKNKNAVGLVYFAGHGIQYNNSGRRYLVPYDGFVKYERDLVEELLPVQLFHDAFKEAGNPLNFLFLDTCRDDPYANQLANFPQNAPLNLPEQIKDKKSNVINSTMPSDTANDGQGNNSPFTRAFLQAIYEWDKDFDETYKLMKLYTSEYANQEIDKNSDAGLGFYFASSKSSYETEKAAWMKANEIGTRHEYTKFIRFYTGGYFYDEALEALRNAPMFAQPLKTMPELKKDASLVQPDYKIRTAPGEQGPVIALTSMTGPKPIVPTQPETTLADGSKWVEFFWPELGSSIYVASEGVKNVPKSSDYVKLAITSDTKFIQTAKPTDKAAGFKTISYDPKVNNLINISTHSNPIAKIEIPVSDPNDFSEQKKAWMAYLDTAVELKRKGVDLSFTTVGFVKRNPAVHDNKTIVDIAYWKGPYTKELFEASAMALTKENLLKDYQAYVPTNDFGMYQPQFR